MLANGRLKDLDIYSFKDYEIALKYFCVCILLTFVCISDVWLYQFYMQKGSGT